MQESIDYFDHDADIGIIGRGNSIEQAFINIAKAMFNISADIKKVTTHQEINLSFNESDLEMALITWLNLLIAKAQSLNLIFADFSLYKEGENWHGIAYGQPWQEQLTRGTEVKGATFAMLSVKKYEEYWEAKCIVDV